jgi:hypothetical protein
MRYILCFIIQALTDDCHCKPILGDYLERPDWPYNFRKYCEEYMRRAAKDCQDLDTLLQDAEKNLEAMAEMETEFNNRMSPLRAAEKRHPRF